MKVEVDSDQLVRNLVQLRHAEARCERPEALAGVRSDLERALGGTVTYAVAARALGISQTALGKWIQRGEISTVLAPNGRRRVPLRELLELAVAVDEHRSEHPADAHPVAAALRRRRDAIEQLDPDDVLPRRYRRGDLSGHRLAELRGLAYHRAVARRLDPRAVADARVRLRRWREEGKIDERYATRWEELLSRPIPSIVELIRKDSPSSRDLRQSSPLTGLLSEAERRRVLEIAC
jgi:hypothetical protein